MYPVYRPQVWRWLDVGFGQKVMCWQDLGLYKDYKEAYDLMYQEKTNGARVQMEMDWVPGLPKTEDKENE